MAAARTRAISRPPRPPMTPPSSTIKPLSAPKSTTVLIWFMVGPCQEKVSG